MDIVQDGKIGTRTNTLLVSYISKEKLNLSNDINMFRYDHEILDNAIRSFQIQNGLEIDGEIGPETEKVLLNHLEMPW
jgi:murein L,D-transpeptidase YcbB/YkuD